MTANGRQRLGHLVGMLGSEHTGERDNALAALERELAAAGLSFGWLAELVEHGERPGGERETLLATLIGDRLRLGLIAAWAMRGDEARYVREILARGESVLDVSAIGLRRAVQIADDARRRAK